jgi:hypothetical protein
MNPADSQTLYAAIGHVFGNSQNGVYKSTDGGASWTKLGGGLPASNVGRISLATTAADSQKVYASIVYNASSSGGGASTLGVYRSDDGGANWSSYYPGSIHSSYGWYLNTIAVSPTNADVAFTGGLYLQRTTNGGSTWTDVQGSQHVDFHALAFDASGRVLAGNDGGFYRSTNLGSSWTIKNEGLGIIQFYAGLSLNPNNQYILYGGTQDNGTLKRTGPDKDDWEGIFGGDGGWTGVKPGSASTVFCEYQGSGTLYRSTNSGGSFSYAGSGINSGDPNCFLCPYDFSPANPNHMLYATNRFYKSTNGGTAWSSISSDLTSGGGAAVRSFAIAPSDADVVYAGTNDGGVLVSFNGGSSWNQRLMNVPGWPRVMRQIAVDPNDPATAYLAVGFFGEDQILKTDDYGVTWDSIDGDLPDIPVNTVALDSRFMPTVIYIGTDCGVYRSADDGATWVKAGEGLPNCAVVDLKVDTANDRLLAATQGRGLWESELSYHLFLRRGNVNLGSGSASDVLLVNGSAGDGERVYSTTTGSPVTMTIAAPPAGPNPADFAMYLITYEPGPSDAAEQPFNIGTSCMAMPLSNGHAMVPPFTIVNTVGYETALGYPLIPAASPAPAEIFSLPGLPLGTYTFQGYIFDNGSAGPNFSLTNAIVLKVL